MSHFRFMLNICDTLHLSQVSKIDFLKIVYILTFPWTSWKKKEVITMINGEVMAFFKHNMTRVFEFLWTIRLQKTSVKLIEKKRKNVEGFKKTYFMSKSTQYRVMLYRGLTILQFYSFKEGSVKIVLNYFFQAFSAKLFLW